MFAVILILMQVSLAQIIINCGILLSSMGIDRDPDKQIAVRALGLFPMYPLYRYTLNILLCRIKLTHYMCYALIGITGTDLYKYWLNGAPDDFNR